ncbi:MAG: RNA methyltransferase [Tissierellia bacterium]|nr:RNA methyltransferase [Tissierellia bacterium]
MHNFINSEENKKIKFIKSLKQKKARTRESTYILEGIKPVMEAITEGIRIREIFLSKSFFEDGMKDYPDLQKQKLNIIEDKIFYQITDTVNSQGIFASVFADLKDVEDILPFGRYILLDGLSDPGNMGGIIRGVDAFGFDGLIVGPNSVDVLNEKVVRSTMSSIFRINIYVMKNMDEMEILKSRMFRILATSLEEKSFTAKDSDLKDNVVIIIGNESQGVSDGMKKFASQSLYIPMVGGAESLNANVSASILMYESMRQRS